MTASFSIDILDTEQQSQLPLYTNLIAWKSTRSDDSSHDYVVLILAGRRTRTPCSLVPSDATTDPDLSRPPRLCHVLANGVQAHQYEVLRPLLGWPTRIKTRILRLIEETPTAIRKESQKGQ